MNNFSERLKSARIMKGFSLQDLADALDNRITKQALSKYEQDLMKPNSENLLLLCRALEVKPDYFSRETTVRLENVEFRKLKKLASKEKESVKQRTIDFLERYYELEDLVGIERDFVNPIKNHTIKSIQDVETAAKKLRSEWKLGEDPIKNVIDLLENHKIKVIELKSDLAFNGLSTFVNSRHPVIVLNSSLDDHVDRKRFTALQELGHLVLNRLEGFDEKVRESYCHAFAAAMLMPEPYLRRKLGDNRQQILLNELILIKNEVGASIQAILYRAKDLNIITPNYFKSYMTRLSSKGMRKNEPGKLTEKEEPHRFKQLLFRAIGEEIISTSKAASLANIKLADLRDELAMKG